MKSDKYVSKHLLLSFSHGGPLLFLMPSQHHVTLLRVSECTNVLEIPLSKFTQAINQPPSQLAVHRGAGGTVMLAGQATPRSPRKLDPEAGIRHVLGWGSFKCRVNRCYFDLIL